MKCPNCEFENDESAKFCEKCGNQLAEAVAEEVKEEISFELEKPKKKRKKISPQVFLGIFMVIVFTGISIASNILVDKISGGTGNSVGNIINCGYVDSSGDYIYFSNTEDNGILYRMKKDGTGLEKIGKDKCFDINVYGNYVYYRAWGEAMPTVNRISVNGGEEEIISQDYGENIQVVDDRVYFIKVYGDGSIYSTNLDGSDEMQLNDDISWELNVVDGWVYFSNDSDEECPGRLYKMRTDGSEKQPVNDEVTWDINVVGDWAYYISVDYMTGATSLVRCKTDGSERLVLTGETSWNTNVYKDYIFYTNELHGDSVWRMNTDGSGNQALTKEGVPCSYVNVVDDVVYYVTEDEEGYQFLYKMDLNGEGQEKLISEE